MTRLRTMRDTISWSYDLLDPAEQSLFQGLAVFAGGFSMEAAAAAAETNDDVVLDGIRSLVAQSLVRYEGDPGGEPRYTMLETIREFGLEQLAASGRKSAVRSRHADWCLSFASAPARMPRKRMPTICWRRWSGSIPICVPRWPGSWTRATETACGWPGRRGRSGSSTPITAKDIAGWTQRSTWAGKRRRRSRSAR